MNLECPHCVGVTFRSSKELKRHAKGHDPKATLFCGCCRNLRRYYNGTARRDKLQDHLKNKHNTSKDNRSNGLSCPVQRCRSLLFTTTSCLEEHIKQEHADGYQEIVDLAANGQHLFSLARELPNDDVSDATCDCSKIAASMSTSAAMKHTTDLPLEPDAKREKLDVSSFRLREPSQDFNLLHESSRSPLILMTSGGNFGQWNDNSDSTYGSDGSSSGLANSWESVNSNQSFVAGPSAARIPSWIGFDPALWQSSCVLAQNTFDMPYQIFLHDGKSADVLIFWQTDGT